MSNHVADLDRARRAASEVAGQWEGVDIDWSSEATVRAELESHWAEYDRADDDTDEYRDLVARELLRAHQRPRASRSGRHVSSRHVVQLPATPDELARFRAAAEEEGLPLGQWLVEAARAYALVRG